MSTQCTIVGPPGTGKTTASLGMVREWFLRYGARPDNVAYLAFTKAAKQEAVDRLRADGVLSDPDEALPFFRTIHSLGYYGMRRERGNEVKVVSTGHMKAFAKETGLDGVFSTYDWEDLSEAYQQMQNFGRTEWDQALAAYRLSRISIRSPHEMASARLQPARAANISIPIDSDVYRAFVERYEAFKAKNGLVDFEDMLYYALERMRPLDEVKYVVVDEAQDLAPILHLIVDRLFRNAKLIVFAGDADQAIYSFAAADAKLFIDRYEKSDWRVLLQQTNRFGQGMVDFTQKVIKRVQHRIDAPVVGLPGRASEIVRTGAFAPSASNSLILHRHVKGCQAVAQAFMDAGLPFRNERGKDPLGAGARMQGYRALRDLSEGSAVTWAAVARLIGDLMPSTSVSDDGADKERFVVHGAKALLQDENRGGHVDLEGLVAANVLTREGASVIRSRSLSRLKHADDLSYYERVIENGYNLSSENMPTITTIHGSKGREASHVVVFSEMGMKCWNDPDTEHRLAYVASSRTKESVEICGEQLLDWAQTRYDYPVGG